jgi:hypothetical protein
MEDMAVRSVTQLDEYQKANHLLADLGASPTGSWPQRLDDVLALRNLHDDWDGQGAEAPDPAVADGALEFARDFQAAQLPPADRVIAGVNGTIFFEWHGSGGYLEIEVTASDRAEGRAVRKGSVVAEVFTLSRRS